jgi:hypothetical protein
MKEQIEELMEQVKDAREAYEEAEDTVHYLAAEEQRPREDPTLLAAKANATKRWHDFCALQNELFTLSKGNKNGQNP